MGAWFAEYPMRLAALAGRVKIYCQHNSDWLEMKMARRLLTGLNSLMDRSSGWAADVDRWICYAVEWSDEAAAHLPPLPDPIHINTDAPGRQARLIQVYTGKLLLATLERTPAPAGNEDHSLYATIKSVRIEWRCRVAGERRLLATLLLMKICSYTVIRECQGLTRVAYSFDPERPSETVLALTWPQKQTAVMSRVVRAHEPREALVEVSPNTYGYSTVIAPTVALHFVK